ncbi:MAG TPA: mechanosensitive ion channel domain-containing protein [Patescibacteria group bacterium]|nr:mechanosensitive ion channel domain-containing protein [Patescibacteria group bacterium]
MQATLQTLYGYAIQYGLNILAAVLIFIIGRWIARLVARLCEKAMLKSKVNKTLAVFTKNIVYFAIVAFAGVAALDKLGVQTTSFIAILGAAGLAVGLALQGSLANFAAGVLIILFQPFKVGDIVEVGGALGTVHEIQIFSTILISPEKKTVIMPNSKITADKIVIHKQ